MFGWVFMWTDGRETDEHCRVDRCDFFLRNSKRFMAQLYTVYCLWNRDRGHVYLKTKQTLRWSAPHRKYCALHCGVGKTAKLLIGTAYKTWLYTWSL